MDRTLHLETIVISRIEGTYATLKAYLQTSTDDLYQVYLSITLAVTNQKKEINSRIEWECINILVFAYNNLLYANLRGKVSIFALKKINDQYQKTTSREPLPPCTRTFSRTMGLLCTYYIQNFEANQSLLLNDIHTHWWIQGRISVTQIEEGNSYNEDLLQPLLQNLEQKYHEWLEHQQVVARNALNDMIDSPLVSLQNPHVVRTKGHPFGAPNRQPANTTRRDSSGFEFVDYKARQCSICKQLDHNACTCPN
ncbi:4770_t:CDS:1 [Cetraspora pellucida]|uniref:4770_t:CDS:1 n=1 Tax=Cetraspora pellucida TaxID=1433469 RepID=A0A9N9JYW2_9GLOM|nr:4770_t:CDS:1 [Cetraspora pellucida]